jgi:hypothetical protein
MPSTRDIFSTVRSEGALLPPDLLRRIAEGDAAVGGLAPSDYHLVGEKVNEAVNRSWNRVVSAWRSFREAAARLPGSDVGTSVTRERWLLPLFNELGYGRLQTAKAIEVGGRSYAVSHVWHYTPIHLVGFRVDVDRRTAGVAGAAKVSPHGLVQDLLNKSEEHLWGILSNGLRLRILRDNVSLVRQAYVEFDLESMMEGQLYADFVLLWLLCHESRVEAEHPSACWLERWTKVADEQGTRALDHLRDGVEAAIQILGQGFLQHQGNRQLLTRLRSGALTTQDYYRQLLRMVYRLIFLFVAEDRDFLFVPGTPEKVKARYREHYSTTRLRRMADRRRGSRHMDLWLGLRLVFGMLNDEGCPELGLPALNSFLWSLDATADLGAGDVQNADLLEAVRALAFTVDNGVRRAVDFRNLGPEELGSIYESLLELHPEINADAGTFSLAASGGNERKTTGSYYTPDALIQQLLDTALDPVLDRATRAEDPQAAILALKVVDPACGSGHFLIAAAHRIGKRLATVRTGEDEPSPESIRHALRDVIGCCIYGVDLNPMAVELCKVSLWMDALEPGKPLSFLDHHVQVGNALLGATPALIGQGIPDDAFANLEGDENAAAGTARKQNKRERERQNLSLFGASMAPWEDARELAVQIASLAGVDDSAVNGVREKQRRYERALQSDAYTRSKLVADAWCSAFVWHKTEDGVPPILSEALYRAQRDPRALSPAQREEVRRLAERYQFFHWHLAFPDVFEVSKEEEDEENAVAGWSGGFDVVLGNPPWDTLSPDAKEFFSRYAPEIRTQDRSGQTATIARLTADPTVAEEWASYRRHLYGTVHFLKKSGRFRMYALGSLGKGDFNIYRMFVETALTFTRPGGYAAQIVPEGIYNGANCMAIRKALFEECELVSLLGFENTRQAWFEGIHGAAKFAIYVARMGVRTASFKAAFNIRDPERLIRVRGGDFVDIPVAMVSEFSPDALAVMEFQDQRQIDIATRLYARWPKFGDESASGPIRTYMREIDMGTDRHLFSEDAVGVPVYEGRMVAQYDHRAKGYRSGRGRSAAWAELPFGAPTKSIQPQWFIRPDLVPEKAVQRLREFRVGFCDVASPTNERTLVATLLPPNVIAGHSVPTFTFAPGYEYAYLPWLAVANSFVMDFVARMKVSLHMTFTVLDSLPFPRLLPHDPLVAWMVPRVLALICTSQEMVPFWNQLAREYDWLEAVSDRRVPPGLLDEEQRQQMKAEVEAMIARDLYALSYEDISHVLDTFPIVARRDIEKFGHFRTKQLVLNAYETLPVVRAVASEDPVPSEFQHGALPTRPQLNPAEEAALAIMALVWASGGSVGLKDLINAFALRTDPPLMVRLASGAMSASVQTWATQVGEIGATSVTLYSTLKTLVDREGLQWALDDSSKPKIETTPHTPPESQIHPWFRVEARLALSVLRTLPAVQLNGLKAALPADDRALLEARAG